MNILDNDYLKKIEKEKDRILKTRIEKNSYLGEFKERVLVALNKDEVLESFIYPEVEKALSKKRAYKLVLSRSISLEKLRKYITLAKEFKVPFKIVDGLSYTGEVALVVVANDVVDLDDEKIIAKSFKERILEKGLDEVFYESLGKKISSKYYEIISEKLPELEELYTPITFMDKLFGIKCPISEKLDN